jgi:hypothetical protein
MTGSSSRCRTALACCLFALSVLLVATAYGQPVKTARGGETLGNVDLPGSDITHFAMDAPAPGTFDLRQQQCSEACGKNLNCVAWTYVKPNTIQGPKGNCWLKNAVPAKKSNACCISGTIGESNVNRAGGDYTHFDNVKGAAVTAQVCQVSCFNDKMCKAWTFVKPNTIQGPKGVCWLKSTVPPPTNNNCCMSGYFETQVIK